MDPAASVPCPLSSVPDMALGGGYASAGRPYEFIVRQLLVVMLRGGGSGFLVPVGASSCNVSAGMVLGIVSLGASAGGNDTSSVALTGLDFPRHKRFLVSGQYVGSSGCFIEHSPAGITGLVDERRALRIDG